MPHEQVKLDNLDSVYRIAYELFIEYGIENTTKKMLVEKSGLSLSSISRYFSSKLDCVLQTAKWFAGNVRETNVLCHARFSDGTHTGHEQIAIYLDVVKELFYENPKLFVFCAECRAYVYRNSNDIKRDCEVLRQALGSFRFVEAIFIKGIKDGSIKPEINAKHEAIILRETYIGFLASMALSSDRDPAFGGVLLAHFIRETLARYGS